MDGIAPLRGNSLPLDHGQPSASGPPRSRRPSRHSRDQPGRGEGPRGLPPGHAAAGLADPGGGPADGHRDVDLGPAAAPRSTRPCAEVTIDPPQYDPVLSTLVSHDIGRHDPHAQEPYIPNLIALLKSRVLAEAVVSSPALASEVSQLDDPAHELILKGL